MPTSTPRGSSNGSPRLWDGPGARALPPLGKCSSAPPPYHANKGTFAGYPGVFFLMGIHPCDGQECTGATLKAMREAFAEDPRLRPSVKSARFYWKDCPPFIQEEAFRVQLAPRQGNGRPVVIHSARRGKGHPAVLEAEGFSGRPVLWHCFSGDAVDFLDRFLANGWHISIPGPVTYPANHDLREAVKRIPRRLDGSKPTAPISRPCRGGASPMNRHSSPSPPKPWPLSAAWPPPNSGRSAATTPGASSTRRQRAITCHSP